MNGLFPGILLAGLLLLPAQAKDAKPTRPPEWLASVPVPKPGDFPLPAPGPLHYSANWSGMPAGNVDITFANDARTQTLLANGRTIGLARVFFSLDATCNAVCDPKNLAPVSTTIVENYGDEKRTTLQEFAPDSMSRTRTSQPAQKDDGKKKTVRLPHIFDLQSSLLYLRSQPLAVGDEIVFLTYATGSPYLAKVSVVKKETITVPAGTFPAIELRLKLTGIDKKLKLQTYKKARGIAAWISDDAERRFLKFTGDLKVGAVNVELEK